jgi:hypothetical protein
MATLIEHLRNKTINFLLKQKIAVTPATQPSEVMGLIKALRPVTTDKPLILLGPDSDGGYLVPDDLDGIKACFSPGVSNIAGFEKDCANRGMDVFMADKSINELPETHPRFHFLKKFISSTNDTDFITLDSWVNQTMDDKTSDLLLQMDIEGFEYETIYSLSDQLKSRFRIIVIEFHWMHLLWSKPYFDVSNRAFRKLLQTHSVVHIHPNNLGKTVKRNNIEIPELIEITFLRNDRIKTKEFTRSFPHPLDVNNTVSAPLVLPASWYQN